MIDDIPSELGSEEKVSNVEMKVCDVPDIDSKLQNFDLHQQTLENVVEVIVTIEGCR